MDLITPVGRIVWGNPSNGKPKTDNNNQPVMGKDGQQQTEWVFGFAVDKNMIGEFVHKETGQKISLWEAMQAEARTIFQNGPPNNFSWKFKDGDGVDPNGQSYANREGHAGCVILTISTTAFAPRIVKLEGGAYVQIDQVKTGDYIRLLLGVKCHGGNPQVRGSVPGLYLNPGMIEFVQAGKEIFSGPDPMSAFGGQAAALPPGAQLAADQPAAMPGGMPGNAPAAPMQPAPQGMPGGGYQQAPAAPQGMPGNVAPGAVQPQPNPAAPQQHSAPGNSTAYPTNVQPAHDFVQNAGQPQPQAPQGMPGGGYQQAPQAPQGMPGIPGGQQ